jgi:hypothetical protein
MTITHDASGKNGPSWTTNTTSLSWTQAISGAHRILWVNVFAYSGTSLLGAAASAVTADGVALTKLEAEIPNSAVGDSFYKATDLWYLIDPPTGAAVDIDVTLTALTDYAHGVSASYKSDTAALEIGTSNSVTSNSSTTGSPACTLTATAGDWLVGSAFSRVGTLTAGAGTAVRQTADGCCIGDSNGPVSAGSRGLNYVASEGSVWPGVLIGSFRETGGGGGATASGVTVTAAATLIPGTASASGSGTATGKTLAAAAGLIAGAASGVITGLLNFQAAGMEFGARTGVDIDTFALDAGVSYRYTVHADGLTLGAAIATSSAENLDSAGKLSNFRSALFTPGSTYRVHAIRQSDGEAATFRMVAQA